MAELLEVPGYWLATSTPLTTTFPELRGSPKHLRRPMSVRHSNTFRRKDFTLSSICMNIHHWRAYLALVIRCIGRAKNSWPLSQTDYWAAEIWSETRHRGPHLWQLPSSPASAYRSESRNIPLTLRAPPGLEKIGIFPAEAAASPLPYRGLNLYTPVVISEPRLTSGCSAPIWNSPELVLSAGYLKWVCKPIASWVAGLPGIPQWGYPVSSITPELEPISC